MSIRIREPIEKEPPEFTVEWYSVGGDGAWMVLENGNIRSFHNSKRKAKRIARQLEQAARNDGERKGGG